MLSRVASSIYWMSRYIERAENYARFIDVLKNLSLELPPTLKEQWNPLVMMTGDALLFDSKYSSYTKSNVIRFLTVDTDNPNSIYSCISKARENARTIRDTLTIEMWFQINEMYLSAQSRQKKKNWTDETLNNFLKEIIDGSQLFSGIMHTTFSHGEAWNFSLVGRMLERGDKITRMIDMKYYYLLPKVEYVGTSLDLLQWSAILKSASAYEMYRKTYPRLTAPHILEFLLFNKDFPRAVRYCVTRAETGIHTITGTPANTYSCEYERELGKLRADMDFTDTNEIIKLGLHDYLIDIETRMNAIGAAISETFFF